MEIKGIKNIELERFERLASLLKMISEKLEKKMNSQLKKYGVTFTQLSIIVLLYTSDREADYSMKELERIFQVSQQTMAGVIKRLEQKGFIGSYSDLHDKRVKRVRLTPSGTNLGESVFSEMKNNEVLLENAVTDEERKTLLELLRKIYNYLDEQ